jgi:hypothetical protein
VGNGDGKATAGVERVGTIEFAAGSGDVFVVRSLVETRWVQQYDPETDKQEWVETDVFSERWIVDEPEKEQETWKRDTDLEKDEGGVWLVSSTGAIRQVSRTSTAAQWEMTDDIEVGQGYFAMKNVTTGEIRISRTGGLTEVAPVVSTQEQRDVESMMTVSVWVPGRTDTGMLAGGTAEGTYETRSLLDIRDGDRWVDAGGRGTWVRGSIGGHAILLRDPDQPEDAIINGQPNLVRAPQRTRKTTTGAPSIAQLSGIPVGSLKPLVLPDGTTVPGVFLFNDGRSLSVFTQSETAGLPPEKIGTITSGSLDDVGALAAEIMNKAAGPNPQYSVAAAENTLEFLWDLYDKGATARENEAGRAFTRAENELTRTATAREGELNRQSQETLTRLANAASLTRTAADFAMESAAYAVAPGQKTVRGTGEGEAFARLAEVSGAEFSPKEVNRIQMDFMEMAAQGREAAGVK